MSQTTNPVHAGAPMLLGFGGWKWDKRRKPAHFRTCSYCGSVHPEDLVAEQDWRPEWADQKYGWPHKFYVDIPDRNGQLDWLGGSTSDMSDEDLARYGWKRIEDLTRKERKVLKRQGINITGPHAYKVAGVGPRASHHAKFYTEHLRDQSISPEVIEAIQQRSGLIFEWLEDGRVSWKPVSA